MRLFFTFCEGVYDAIQVLRSQLVVIRDLDVLLGSIDEERLVVCLALFSRP